MPAIINTNIASLNAQRNLNSSQSALQTSLQRLSSGLRINSAKDDAAGLAISERFSTQIRGLNQAARNANDGISLAQTGEGALSAVTDNLQRIRELAVQAANSTNSADDRAALQLEVAQRLAEIDRTASQTSFNGQKLLDGSFTAAAFQIGANAGETISVSGLGTGVRLSATGQIASATSAVLGAGATGGSVVTGAITPGDFSVPATQLTSGSLTLNPATRMFGTAAQNFVGGASDAKTVATTDFSQAGQPLTSGSVTFTATDMQFAAAVPGSSAAVTFSGTPLTTDFSVAGQALIEGTNVQTIAGRNVQTGVAAAAFVGVDFSGANTTTLTVDGVDTVTLNSATGYADAPTLLAAINGQLTTSTASFNSDGNLTFTRNAGAGAGAAVGVAVVADPTAKGFASTAGTSAFDFSGGNLAQFNVDGTQGVTLTAAYANEADLAAAIQAQLTGITVAGVNGTGELTFTRTGSDAAVAISVTDVNASLAGIASSAGVAGQPLIPTTNATFDINGGDGAATITLDTASAGGSMATFINNLNTAIQNSTLVDKANYVAVANGTTGFTIQHTGSTAAVNIIGSNATTAGANAIAMGIVSGTTAGTAGSVTNDPVSFTVDAGGPNATVVSLSANYASYDDMRAAIDAQLDNALFTITNTPTGDFTITRADSSGAGSTGINITGDAAADTAGISLNEVSTAGQDAITRTQSTFTVGATSVTLDQNYGSAQAVQDAIQAQLGGAYNVTRVGNDYTFTSTASSAAVAVSVAADPNGTAASALGFTASAGVAGQAAVATTNATFQIDNLAITLNTDFASFDEMATGVGVGSLQEKLDAVAAGVYTVSNNAGAITISKVATGAASTAPAITVADPVSGAVGLAAGAGTAVNGTDATPGSSVNLTINGQAISLTGNNGTLAAVQGELQTKLNTAFGANAYTVGISGTGLSITNATAGSAAVSLTADNAAATAAGFGTIASSAAGVAGGTVTLTDLTINGVAMAGTYANAAALATAVNANVTGVYATVDNNGAMTLSSSAAVTLAGATDTAALGLTAGTVAATAGSLADATVATAAAANLTIQRIDAALTSVSNLRSTFGAVQNRFESVISSLSATSENLTAARSRIQDTDFAAETAQLTRNQILQQAGTAMLAQANQLPNTVLSLLR